MDQDANKFEVKKLNDFIEFLQTLIKPTKEHASLIQKYHAEMKQKNFPATLKLIPKLMEKNKQLIELLKRNPDSKIMQLENYLLEFEGWLSYEKNQESDRRIQYTSEFMSNLARHFKESNLNLEGNDPKLTCKNFKFILDSIKLKINIMYGGDEEKFKSLESWNLLELTNTVKNFYDYFDKLNLQDEMKIIFDCYVSIIKSKNQQLGDWIQINEILNKYFHEKENRKIELPYSKSAIFSYLIYKITHDQVTVEQKRVGKRTATHSATIKKDEHLWIPRTNEDLVGENIMYLNFL